MRSGWSVVAVTGLLVATGAGVLFVWQWEIPKGSDATSSNQSQLIENNRIKTPPPIVQSPVAPPDVMPAASESNQSTKDATSPSAASQPAKPNSTRQAVPLKGAKHPPKDPLARLALAFVGADPQAEAYWISSINNPQLPENERKDLIEDLNEDGLSDPDHPAMGDLPLIISRLELIEQVGPWAMDKVNAEAFAEAHKDLTQMADMLQGGSGAGGK